MLTSRRERIRRRFWKPRSVYQHPQWLMKVQAAKDAQAAFDQLPQPIRIAMAHARRDFSAKQMLDLWEQTGVMGSHDQRVDYLLRTIEANDRH